MLKGNVIVIGGECSTILETKGLGKVIKPKKCNHLNINDIKNEDCLGFLDKETGQWKFRWD